MMPSKHKLGTSESVSQVGGLAGRTGRNKAPGTVANRQSAHEDNATSMTAPSKMPERT